MEVEDDASTLPSSVKPNGSSGGASNGGESSGGDSASSNDGSSGQGASGGSSSSSGDANAPPSLADSASSIPDVDVPDVHVLSPDASYADAGDPCDLDQDGFRASGTCGGTDCCDYDGRAYPGEKSFYATPDACGSFDYDCDTKNEPQYTTVNCQFGVFTCNGDGFDKTPPPCGVVATFDSCDYYVVYCGTSQSSKAQGCK
jgi:hypothetical protein